MIKEIVEREVDNTLSNKLPHTKVPQIVLGLITKGGSSEVNLKILDEYYNIDSKYAEIPRVRVNRNYEKGDRVVVLFLFGKLEMPYVLEEYEL